MDPASSPQGIVTVEHHILEGQREHPEATGEFSWLLSEITLASKMIAGQVRRAGLADILGSAGRKNVQGEVVQKLDEIANVTIQQCLAYRESVSIILSEELDNPRVLKQATDGEKYIVVFDPLDGSSNIDVNVSTGTIFSILQRQSDVPSSDPSAQLLQPGVRQLAAGYVIYSSSTVFVYTTGHGVHLFTLDPFIGDYVLTRESITMPASGSTYSVNEAYAADFPEPYQRYLAWVKDQSRSLRYVGSLVTDFHRTLLKGGLFLYPPTKKHPDGKLRLLYEANPLAFLAEQAGGKATDGQNRILDKIPTDIHQRTSLVIGSREEVDRLASFTSSDDSGTRR